MTCIVALRHQGKVYLGGDSVACDGDRIQLVARPKVFQLGEFLIGFTDSFRMGQLLEFNLEVPASAEPDDLRYMVRTFVPAVQRCFENGGFGRNQEGELAGGCFIVGYRGNIYVVHSDYQVNQYTDEYIAIGAGYQYALGSIESCMRMVPNLQPEQAVEEALRVATKFSPFVRGKFTVISL
jgi:ATP-dependent protease HslVU (ClpYQ) peptidase subunit